MSGVFQIDRKIFESDIWNNVIEFRIFFYILGNAIWKKEGVHVGNIHIKRGQYLRSYRNLREDLMYIENNAIKYYSLSTLKRAVDKLVLDERLDKEETPLGTLFTVVNYCEYQWLRGVVSDNLEQQRNSDGTPTEQQENNKNKDNTDNKDTITTITGNVNSVADIGADPIQQNRESVAQVGAVPTKQMNPVEEIERYYLQIRNRNMCSSNDMMNIVATYKKYQDLGFILETMKKAAKENKVRNGQLTINSFNYFLSIFEEEWRKLKVKKEGVSSGPTPEDGGKNTKFDKSKFLWNGGEG